MTNRSEVNWKSAAMAAVMSIGVFAVGAATIYAGASWVGRSQYALAISQMGPGTAELMVQDTVRIVVGAESAYMSGMMTGYADGAQGVSRKFRALQGGFDTDLSAPMEYREAGARAQADAPLSEAQLIELAEDVAERHEGMRALLQTAQDALSGSGVGQTDLRGTAALLIMDRLARAGLLRIDPRVADRIGELADEALRDPVVAGRANEVRALVDAGLAPHLIRSPSVALGAARLVNMAPGANLAESHSPIAQRHGMQLQPEVTHRNVAHVEVEDPFADGVRIQIDQGSSF